MLIEKLENQAIVPVEKIQAGSCFEWDQKIYTMIDKYSAPALSDAVPNWSNYIFALELETGRIVKLYTTRLVIKKNFKAVETETDTRSNKSKTINPGILGAK